MKKTFLETDKHYKEIDFSGFESYYNKLPSDYKKVIYNTMLQMPHPNSYLYVNYIIFSEIERKMKEKNIGYEELFTRIYEITNNGTEKKTYESFLNRKSINSGLLAPTCQILEIPLEAIRKNLPIQSYDRSSLLGLYYSLSKKDAKTIRYITNSLYLLLYSPEFFNDNETYSDTFL